MALNAIDTSTNDMDFKTLPPWGNRVSRRLAGLLAGVLLPSVAVAQPVGAWSVKLGYNRISPQVTSAELSAPSLPGGRAEVGPANNLLFTIAYRLDERLSAELFLGTPLKHELTGDGSLKGVGHLGNVTQLPPTAFLQYRPGSSRWTLRPYVGLGLTFAFFRDETGSSTLDAVTNPGSTEATTFKVKDAVGITPQVGLTYAWQQDWFVDFGVAKSFIKTTATFSTGQSIGVRLDPWIANVSIGRRF
jgi:outer membrane protein